MLLLLLVAAVAFIIWVVVTRQRFFYDWYEPIYHKYRCAGDKWGEPRKVRVPKQGYAAVHVVTSAHRDQSNLFACGIGSFESKDSGTDVPIEEVMKMKLVSLFDAHEAQQMYIFFQVTPKFWEHPFHGMGHRDELKIGAKVYFVNMKDADEWTNNNCKDVPGSEMLFMWNTSRCGSTLMTRILDKVGAIGISEPMFITSMYNNIRHNVPLTEEQLIQRIRTTCLMERQLVKNTFPKKYRKLCIKPQMGVKLVLECEKAFPGSKHMLIYRNAGKCVESMGSIGASTSSLLHKIKVAFSVSMQYPPRKLSYPGLYEKLGWGVMHPIGNIMTCEWVDYVWYWMQICDITDLPKYNSPKLKESLTYRFEELVSKDEDCLLQMLEFCGFGRADIPAALSGFEKHSQANHIAQQSSSRTGERFLTKEREEQIDQFTKACGIPEILKNSIKPRKQAAV